jgi:hypothetical protein
MNTVDIKGDGLQRTILLVVVVCVFIHRTLVRQWRPFVSGDCLHTMGRVRKPQLPAGFMCKTFTGTIVDLGAGRKTARTIQEVVHVSFELETPEPGKCC